MNGYTDDQIIDIMEDNGIGTTKDPYQAIYILRDGTYLSGMFSYGSRSEDHRCIESCIDDYDRYDGQKFWSAVHQNLGVVMVVPETKELLIMKNQKLTIDQWNQIDADFQEFSLDEYCENLLEIEVEIESEAR